MYERPAFKSFPIPDKPKHREIMAPGISYAVIRCLQRNSDMGIFIENATIPKNCFRCFASFWQDFGGENRGFRCRAIPNDCKTVSNCEGREKRRDDCPLIQVAAMTDKTVAGLRNQEEAGRLNYVCPSCHNADHPPGARFCYICGMGFPLSIQPKSKTE